jgi:hypothetical protein
VICSDLTTCVVSNTVKMALSSAGIGRNLAKCEGKARRPMGRELVHLPDEGMKSCLNQLSVKRIT